MKTYILFLAIALNGCATCREHPVMCSVVTAIAVGSVAATVQHHHDQQQSRDFNQRFGFCTNQNNPECR